MSCLYKLLMAIPAKRITNFSIANDLLLAEQKSARRSEGCYEHAFLLESIVNDARRQPRPLYLARLDIRNPFGSIPHTTLLSTLSHMGFPKPLIDMIGNVYTGATTEVLTPIGKTPLIPIHSGIKQGCPLSAILFNLTLELILRKCSAKAMTSPQGPLKHHGIALSVLAYADDLVIMARNADSLQLLLDEASLAANTLGLEFRPNKCASLSLTKRTPRIQQNDFLVQTKSIPALQREDHYRYLGVPIGLLHNVTQIESLVDELSSKLVRIEQSLLAPWQKLDAIRTFGQPCLTYALRSTDPTTKSLQGYRSQLLKTVRSICSLPTRATTLYIFGAKQAGALGFTDPCHKNHLQTVVQAVKMLSSADPTVATIAKRELRHTVRFTAQADHTPTLVASFLSNAEGRRLDTIRYRTGSLWTRTRSATKHVRISIAVPDIGPPTITHAEPVQAKDVCRFLHNVARNDSAKKLRELCNQGKVARALSTDPYANGSSWQFSGLNMRFKDWRFIHKVRLNCLPTNAVKSGWSDANPTCRHCEQPETLPHIICHCPPNMASITDRHNRIVDRLKKAIRNGDVTTDRTVENSHSPVRPDNERVLSALGMSRRYKNLFRKLCCSDVIQGSTDIYRQHLGCDDVPS